MRVFPIALALAASSFVAGCASSAPPAKIPEPIAFDKADYTPPPDFDMQIQLGDLGGKQLKAPPQSIAPKLVSMQKPGAAAEE